MRASGCEEDEELDFRLTFGEELEVPRSGPGASDLEADETPAYSKDPSFTVNRPIGIPRHGVPGRAGMHSPPPRPVTNGDTYESQPARLIHLGGCKVLACPSIQITSISPPSDGGQEMELADEDCGPDGWGDPRPQLSSSSSSSPFGRDHLYLPLDPFGYRDCSLSPSSASSFSSRGWLSDAASSCGSASHVYDDVEPELREAALRFALASPSPGRAWPLDEAWASPSSPSSPCPSPVMDESSRLSPRGGPPSGPPSRPSSPCGKRRHSGPEACSYYYHYQHHQRSGSSRPSPSPSPVTSRRGSITDEALSPQEAPSSLLHLQLPPAFEGGASVTGDIPHKARRTSQEQTVALFREAEETEGEAGGNQYPGIGTGLAGEEGTVTYQLLKKDMVPMEYLTVPSPFVWTKARVGGHSPIFRASALPPLDWPLPSHYEHLELKIEVQPKTHHRAHYETEGSRGAVKAAGGGHPVVKLQGYTEKPLMLQMFIGTADERNLRPHAFYQVHRITGKMVATSSQEAVVSTTKILEVSLLPESNMTANIDCAGILKLRNSDIELRKGETDIGRKNTRVKLVFRVHVPQPNGKVVSLQVTSVPIECSQRSAHELPQVESCNVTSCPVTGGEELLLTGCNFLPESKVVFIEKGPEGQSQWEVDAKVDREKSTESLIVAEVPPYRNQTLTRAAPVCFLVCNGKRKRSLCQCFQYLPVLVKEEPRQEFELCPSSPLHSPAEYPPRVPAANRCPRPSAISDQGPLGPASPSSPLPNPGCPGPKVFSEPSPLPLPVSGLPAFLLDTGWNEACELLPPGFGCSLTQANHGHLFNQHNYSYPFTPPNHGQPLAHPPLGHSCSYSPPEWVTPHSLPSRSTSHLGPLASPSPYYPSPTDSTNHPLSPAQLAGNGPGPPTPLGVQRDRALYPTEPPASQACPARPLTPYSPAFLPGPRPTPPAAPLHREPGADGPTHSPAYRPCAFQCERGTVDSQEDPPHSAPSTHLQAVEDGPFLESEARAIKRSQADGEGQPGAPLEKPAVDAKREVEDCEVPFSTIPIQGITLDDVNEIIGRDLTDVSDPRGTDDTADKP